MHYYLFIIIIIICSIHTIFSPILVHRSRIAKQTEYYSPIRHEAR